MERELKFGFNVESNALLCPNPAEFYTRAYVSDNVADNFRLLPGIKYKTKIANNEFARALYASKCKFEDIAQSDLDAIDIDVASVSALAEICQFDAEQAFFSEMIRPGSNHAEFTPEMFMTHYWNSLASKVEEEIAIMRWQGDTALPTTGATGYLGEVDGYEKKLLAGVADDVIGIAGSGITKANVIDEMAKVYEALPSQLAHKVDSLRFYVSANVAASYLQAVAENNTVLYTTMNPQLTWLGRIQIVIQEGMSDNTMVLTRKENLIYAFDALADGSDLKALNLTDVTAEPLLRTRTNLKLGFFLSNPAEIVYYSEDVTP